MLGGIHLPFRCNLVLASAIKGHDQIVRMRACAMFGNAHHGVQRLHQVAVLELRGPRPKLDLQGLKRSFGPQFTAPYALVILSSHHVEVLVTVAGKDLSKGLKGHCNPPLQLEDHGILVLVCL